MQDSVSLRMAKGAITTYVGSGGARVLRKAGGVDGVVLRVVSAEVSQGGACWSYNLATRKLGLDIPVHDREARRFTLCFSRASGVQERCSGMSR